jgi:hypothetical protein
MPREVIVKRAIAVIAIALLGIALGGSLSRRASAQQPGSTLAPMGLTNRVALPGVVGRLDHLTTDNKHGRVIVAGLGNNTVEVVAGFPLKDIHSIPGQDGPQGVLYVQEIDKLFVSNEGGKVNVYEGDDYKFVKAIDFKDGADNLRYDPVEKLVYVSYKEGIGLIDTKTLERLPTVYRFAEQPESYRLETNGPRIFVNLPDHYELIGKIPTFTGARTSVVWEEYRARQGMVIAVPATSNQGAELWFTQFRDY